MESKPHPEKQVCRVPGFSGALLQVEPKGKQGTLGGLSLETDPTGTVLACYPAGPGMRGFWLATLPTGSWIFQGYLRHGGPLLGPPVQAAASQVTKCQAQLRQAWPRPGVQVLLINLGSDGSSPGIYGCTSLESALGAFQGHSSLLSLVFNQVFLWDRHCEHGFWVGRTSAGFPRLLHSVVWFSFSRFIEHTLCASAAPGSRDTMTNRTPWALPHQANFLAGEERHQQTYWLVSKDHEA